MTLHSGLVVKQAHVCQFLRLVGVHGFVYGAVISFHISTNPILDSKGVTASSSGGVDCWFLLLLVFWDFLRVSKEIANVEKIRNQRGAFDQVVEVDFKVVHQLLSGEP